MLITVNKPKGPSSFKIIEEIRKETGIKKVGHAGTLDPLASGVLVVAVGRESTKKLGLILNKEKEYLAKIKLGFESETDDEEGDKVEVNFRQPSKKEIEKAIKNFVGNIKQVPPNYSAIKIKGKRAYKLARQGQKVVMKERDAVVKKIILVKYEYPFIYLKIICGPGVYIRSIARDIGNVLATGAYLADLERTRVGEYHLEDAVPLKMIKKISKWNDIAKELNEGKIGVIPTDTIYGLVGKALNKKVVQRIYDVKGRRPDKPMIILISSFEDIKLFGVKISKKESEIMKELWPGKVSIILTCKVKKLEYLHRGTDSLAFRFPDKLELIYLLKNSGPLIAPSANPESLSPATKINEAKKYFGKNIDFYLSGKVNSEPSTLIKIENNKLIVLREGAVKIKKAE